MRRIAIITVTILLVAVIALQVLAALNIFPRQNRVPVCPVDAISMKGGKARIDPKKCIGCRRCVAGICLPVEVVSDTGLVSQSALPVVESGKTLTASPTGNPLAKSNTGTEKPILKDDKTLPVTPVDKSATKANQKPEKTSPKAAESKKIIYQVNADKCIGCGLCTLYCPEMAIAMQGDKAVIDQKKCIDCGICKNGNGKYFKGCPFKAIAGP